MRSVDVAGYLVGAGIVGVFHVIIARILPQISVSSRNDSDGFGNGLLLSFSSAIGLWQLFDVVPLVLGLNFFRQSAIAIGVVIATAVTALVNLILFVF